MDRTGPRQTHPEQVRLELAFACRRVGTPAAGRRNRFWVRALILQHGELTSSGRRPRRLHRLRFRRMTTGAAVWQSDLFGTLNDLPPEPVAQLGRSLEIMGSE